MKVVLEEYNPNWKLQFEQEKQNLQLTIGNTLKGIEHIGSTSVPGLMAKPIIDIMIGFESLGETTMFVQRLRDIKYEYVPKLEFKDRYFFRKGPYRDGICHLHICEFRSQEWNDKILFRDKLRSEKKLREEYTQLKEYLASKFENDRSTYTKSKEPFIQKVIRKNE